MLTARFRRNETRTLHGCRKSADLPEYGLRKGDVVKLVEELEAVDGSCGYVVEVFDVVGNTIDVHLIPADTVEPLRQGEVFCVRPREHAAA